jgi:hypothetical protein
MQKAGSQDKLFWQQPTPASDLERLPAQVISAKDIRIIASMSRITARFLAW